MTDEQRVSEFRAHGHDAHLLRDRRIVLRLNGQWYRVVGGDFRYPSLLQLPRPIEMFDATQDPAPRPRGFVGVKG